MRLYLLALPWLTATALAFADDSALDYIYTDLLLEGGVRENYDRCIAALSRNELDPALAVCEQALEDNLYLTDDDPASYGRLLANVGMIHAAMGNYERGKAELDRAVTFMETRDNRFSPTLVNVAMASGIAALHASDYEAAEEAFRRAQHITHRHSGVYTPEQLPVVDYLTRTFLRMGKVEEADREQLFNLRVSEQAYGENSEALVPVLSEIGYYFAERGSQIPRGPNVSDEYRFYRDTLFRQSISMYSRAVEIIEDNYGTNDLRLVQVLRGTARARRLQDTNHTAAERALERALNVVANNPETDVTDYIMSLVHLGDMYTITGDPRAAETYEAAWIELHRTDEYAVLSNEIFATPTRLHPLEMQVVFLDRRPDAAETDGAAQLFMDLSYTVRADGRVGTIRLIDKNVPNSSLRYMRDKLTDARFRPRMVDGSVVATQNMTMRQLFDVSPTPRELAESADN